MKGKREEGKEKGREGRRKGRREGGREKGRAKIPIPHLTTDLRAKRWISKHYLYTQMYNTTLHNN